MDRFLALLLGLRYETNYNIGSHVYEINCSLAFLWCHCFLLHFRLRYNPWVWILGVPYFLILSIISETKISTFQRSKVLLTHQKTQFSTRWIISYTYYYKNYVNIVLKFAKFTQNKKNLHFCKKSLTNFTLLFYFIIGC